MSKFTHPICGRCWKRHHNFQPWPLARAYRETETCCWCQHRTKSGIYVSDLPENIPGHIEHAEAS